MKMYRSIGIVACVVLLGSLVSTMGGAATTSGIQVYSTLQEFEAQGGKIEQFSQSPFLDGKDLPSVAERVSEEPLVIQPYEEIGVFGGTARIFTKRPNVDEDGAALISWEGLVRLEHDDADFVPNVAKSYVWSDEGKTLTFSLRKGMQWSDGAPFTTEDIRFWWEDIILNDDLNPNKPKIWKSGGKLMEVVIIDEVTVQFKFQNRYPTVINQVGHFQGFRILRPAHYLKQFHITYNEKADEQAKAAGHDHWYQWFQEHIPNPGRGLATDTLIPTLAPYVMTEKSSDHWIFERNPYYWKADTAGNQLPYIDRIFLQLGSNTEMIDAKVISGEADLAMYNTSLENYPLYKESEAQGNYRTLLWTFPVTPVIMPNQTYTEDPVLRELFRDVRFRKALSVAIDRDEINEALFFGKAVPRQQTVVSSSKYFKPEFEQAYAYLNLDEANAYLDEIGLSWDDKKQWRLRSDGKPLTIILEYSKLELAAIQPMIEMIQRHWQKIGVQLVLKLQSGSLIKERNMGNLNQMGLWHGGSLTDHMFISNPRWFLPYRELNSNAWGPFWAKWYVTDGEAGEEPPENVKQNIERWKQMQASIDEDEVVRLGQEILQSQAENLWCIGVVGMTPIPFIVRENLRNVPETGMRAWDNFYGMNYYPEQRFFKPPLLKSQQ